LSLVSQLEPSGTNWIKTKEKYASREKIRKWKSGLIQTLYYYIFLPINGQITVFKLIELIIQACNDTVLVHLLQDANLSFSFSQQQLGTQYNE
jgi:hypothetical protein